MATAADNEFLIQSAIYLGATAVAVPIFKKLKLGTILGFLAAGIILGPSLLGWLDPGEGVFHIAELGVVLFLFVIGLELSFPRLWSLRQTIFGLGLSQMVITGLIIGYGLYFFNVFAIGPAMVAGFGLACSSTAFALSLLEERREMNTPHGTKAFSVLLLQDVAVIPLLASIPFVAMQMNGADESMAFDPWALARAAAVILGIVIIGKYALNFFFRIVALSGSREAFTAAALFVVAGTALSVNEVGLSMALGAFLAGVVLAESAFRHQIESDIEPFRELLLGLFFIGVGMQLNLDVVFDAWLIVLLGAVGLILLKGAIIFLLARLFGSDFMTALRTGAVLSQGGEFGFVVFSLGVGEGVFGGNNATLFSAIITLSMIATPVIMMLIERINIQSTTQMKEIGEGEMKGSVLIVGFGRIGQLVNQVLVSSGVEVTAIDSDPKRIELAAEFGNKVYFGDGTNVNLLMQAGATKVDAIVFAISAREKLKPTIAAVRERCPKVRILARVYDRIHEMEVMDAESDLLVREMFESSMKIATETLSFLGFSDGLIGEISDEYRQRDRDRLLAQKAEGMYARKEDLRRPFDAVQKRDGSD